MAKASSKLVLLFRFPHSPLNMEVGRKRGARRRNPLHLSVINAHVESVREQLLQMSGAVGVAMDQDGTCDNSEALAEMVLGVSVYLYICITGLK